MKRVILKSLGKALILFSSLLWKGNCKFCYRLHQKIGMFVINLHHSHDLDLLPEEKHS